MSNFTVTPDDQHTYSLTPLPGVDQTLTGEVGETIYVPLATNNTFGVVKPGTYLDIENGAPGVLQVKTDDLPISDATQQALDTKLEGIKKNGTDVPLVENTLIADLTVTKSDVGLSNVDNTSDMNKPISTATQTALDNIVNNVTPIKASNGSVQLGFKTVEPAANSLQFRNYNFLNADGELYTNTGSVMTKVADVDTTQNMIEDNVSDSLTDTSATKALSAKQGKILKDLVDGKQQTETYSTISAMVTALNAASSTQFKQGYNFYVVDVEVPDFWVTSVENSSVAYTYTTDTALVNAVKQAPVQIGYYKISLLETAKVETKDAVDYRTINRNLSDELQTIGVIDQQSGNANKVWTGTLAQYNAIVTKDDDTLYIITDDANSVSAIPETTSDLINDSGFIDNTVNNLTNYTKTSDLGDMAFKDTVDYSTDVINKPTINNGLLTIQKNGTTIATFTANTANNVVANIEADQQVQTDWNQTDTDAPDYIKNKPSIPTKVSDLTNDSGFIINTVNDLTNYYLKSETYTQSEVNSLIGAIKTIEVTVVETLPTATADTYFNTSKTIYIVAISGSENDYYDEYITVRSGTEGSYTYSWEKIGNTQIDLTNYVQKTFTIAGIDMQDNITKSELASALGVQADLNLLNGEGTNSLKMKNNNTVSGNNSFAEGSNNVVFANNSHAEGYSVTKATSRGITTSSTDAEIETEWLASDPEGDKFSLAKGENSHIEGSNCLALGGNSHAEGNGTRAMNNSAHSEGTGTKASGKYSHAEGLETLASGGRAHSEGDSTEATADYTHAEGRGTKAYGKYAHVEGRDTQVNANIEYSHAEGRNTIAAHSYSHVEGQGTITSRSHQHVSGKFNTGDTTAYLIVGDGSADNSRSNCFSAGNDGTNKYIKIGNTKITDANAVTKAVNDLTNYYTKSETYTKSEVDNLIGSAMNINFSVVQALPEPTSSTYFNTSKTVYMILNTSPSGNDYYDEYITIMRGYAYIWEQIGTTRVDLTGYVKDVAIQHGDNNGPTVATAIIANDLYGNIASGEYCFAEGKQNHATGALGAHAEGYYNVASGAHSHAEGEDNTASGQDAHVEGYHNVASGYGAHSEGGQTSATYDYAHAEGQFTTSNGFAAHSEGCQTTTGQYARQSHAEGYFTEAHNYQSHAEGDYSIAGFNDDTVETFDISATYAENTVVKNGTGLYYLCIKASTGNALDNTTYWNLIESNHAEGQNTRSTSVASHSEGINSIASGKASHAEGNGTYATNNSAHSEGTGSTASGKYSHAEGMESVASGSRSHAEGYTTTASGDSAHSQGRESVASGKYSFASGRNVTASKENQSVFGQYNATDNEALLIVGTGSKSGSTINSRNSFATGHDGTESFIKVGSTKFRESEIAKKSEIPIKSISVVGTSLTPDANGNVNIPVGKDGGYNSTNKGVISVCSFSGLSLSGIDINGGHLWCASTDANSISTRGKSGGVIPRILTNDKINDIVKAALTDSNHLTMTVAEQTVAKSVLGVATIKTTMDNVAEVNTEYYLGTQSTVSITLPASANAGDKITVDFTSGSTATTLTLTGNNIAGDTSFVPEANKLIEMNFKYDGTYWKLLVSSLDIPSGV